MKRLITLMLLVFVALGVNAQTSSSSPQLAPHEQLYGTWVLSLQELVEGDDVPEMSIYFNFARDMKLYIYSSSVVQTGEYKLKLENGETKDLEIQYDCSVNMTIDWSASSRKIMFHNIAECKQKYWVGNLYIKNDYKQYSKYIPRIEEELMSMLEFAEGMKLGLTDEEDVESVSLPYQIMSDAAMKWQIDEELPSIMLRRYSLIKPSKSVYTLGEPIEISYIDGGVVCDPNEYAFLTLSRYNEKGEWASAWFSDTPTEIGTYRYIAEDDGYNSNMAIVSVVPSLQLNVSGYEAKKERHRRVIRTKTDSTLVADRYLQLSDTKVRIMPNDSASFKVINNGEDVTKESQISYIMRGQLLPLSNNIFKNRNTSYDFTAEYNGMQTPYCNVELTNPVILHIKQDTVEIGEAFHYSTYHFDTANPNSLEMFVEGSELRDKRDRVVARDGRMFYHTSAGTYRYYANDDKVRSDYDSIVVVEPDPIVLTIDTCKRDMRTLRSGIYLIEIDGHPIRFRVKQNGKDVTDKSKICDAEGNPVNIFHYIRKPGFYRFYATHGYNNKSEAIVVEAHEKLCIYYDRIKYKDTDSVILTAKQDGIDVTQQCKFYHKYWRDNKEHELIGFRHYLSSAEEGLHTYWAVREDFYESYKALVFHHPRKKGGGRKTLTVKADRDTIILGDSVMVTSLLNGKPTEATIYANGEVLMSQYYTPQSIGQSVFVAYKDKLTSDEEFVVVIPEEESGEEPTPEEPNDEATEVPGGGDYGTGYHPQQSWVGTYSVTTPQKLVFDADGNISLVDDPETFEITITKEGHYRIYGLSKDNPEADVIALELGDDALAFNGSYFRTSSHADTIIRVDSTLTSKPQVDTLLVGKKDVEPMWVYTMQLTDGDADNAVMSYRHYVNPRFTIPYILTRDEAGRMTCTVAMPNCGDMQCKMVSVELFDVDKSSNTIRHRKPEGVKSYRAGGLTNIRKTSSVAKPIERTDSMLQHRSLLLLTPRQAIDEGMMFEPKADAGL